MGNAPASTDAMPLHQHTDAQRFHRILVTDCGSTTTKALLFECDSNGRWFTKARGEAPTTVEAPIADVTVGAVNAFTEIEEVTGISLLDRTILSDAGAQRGPFLSRRDQHGIDLYLSTSSAGGGLQMLVAGVSTQYSAASAARAALGAGAIVMDTIAAEDSRTALEWIDRLRHLKPDIVLLAGGTDGGATAYAIEVAELLLQARPRPRFGATIKVPVIFAGNAAIATEITELLSPIADVSTVANVRATLDDEQIAPARDAVHELFLSHVMSHAPGYGKLLAWSPFPILPTPAAAGDMVQRYAISKGISALCADIGGATTDVFSVFPDDEGKPVFNRTVSANVGMSYSVGNVLKEAGIDNIARWLPERERADSATLDHRIRNKMIRPTSIPQTADDLAVEQAVCREALRLSLVHHRSLAVNSTKRARGRTFGEIFGSRGARRELVDLLRLDMVIGSGGVLSHAPRRFDAAMMMIDGFGLEGVTQVCVDSVFMMPHLGVLASVDPQAAVALFEHECLVNICHHIRPVSHRSVRSGRLATIQFEGEEIGAVQHGEFSVLADAKNMTGTLKVTPAGSRIDVGAGPGEVYERTISIGGEGLVLDGRPHVVTVERARSA